jgi:hypothetical protein
MNTMITEKAHETRPGPVYRRGAGLPGSETLTFLQDALLK